MNDRRDEPKTLTNLTKHGLVFAVLGTEGVSVISMRPASRKEMHKTLNPDRYFRI